MSEVVTQERISIYNSAAADGPDQFAVCMTRKELSTAIQDLSQSLLSFDITKFNSKFSGEDNFITTSAENTHFYSNKSDTEQNRLSDMDVRVDRPDLIPSICDIPGQYPIWNKIQSIILQLVARYVESPDPESFAYGGHGCVHLNTKTHDVRIDWTKLVKRDVSIYMKF